jgi:hypothetical protein
MRHLTLRLEGEPLQPFGKLVAGGKLEPASGLVEKNPASTRIALQLRLPLALLGVPVALTNLFAQVFEHRSPDLCPQAAQLFNVLALLLTCDSNRRAATGDLPPSSFAASC